MNTHRTRSNTDRFSVSFLKLALPFLCLASTFVMGQSMEKGSLSAGKFPLSEPTKAKTILEKEGQKVIYKPLLKDELMPFHTNPTAVLVVIVSGKMRITLDKETADFEAGDYVIFPAGIKHELLCLENAKILIYK